MADLSGRTLGEFTLHEQIGEGGYGLVYRAEQHALEREVVVKVLREERGSPARPGHPRDSHPPPCLRPDRRAPAHGRHDG